MTGIVWLMGFDVECLWSFGMGAIPFGSGFDVSNELLPFEIVRLWCDCPSVSTVIMDQIAAINCIVQTGFDFLFGQYLAN